MGSGQERRPGYLAMQRSEAFTLKASHLADVIVSECWISAACNPASWGPHFNVNASPALPAGLEKFAAVWDTGASRSCISRRVVEACGLSPAGRATIAGHKGEFKSDVYRVNILLPNSIVFTNVLVSGLQHVACGEAIIGMDIISQGDLAISNVNGRTLFSFRAPSVKAVDFVEEQDIFEGFKR
jgi:hypothetical protein